MMLKPRHWRIESRHRSSDVDASRCQYDLWYLSFVFSSSLGFQIMVKMVGIFGLNWRQKSRHVSILEIFMHAKKIAFGMKSRCINVWGANCLFLACMKFTDGRFQECLFQDLSGVCAAGARCCRRCRSHAMDEARDPTGHSMGTVWIFQKFPGVKVIFLVWGRRSGFKTFTDFGVLDRHEHCWIELQTEQWTLVKLGHLKAHIILMPVKDVTGDLGWNPGASRFLRC